MSGLAAEQRAALATALESVDPGSPTLDEGWTAADLAAHIVIRDRRPDSMPGAVMAAGPLRDWSERVRVQRRDGMPYRELVALVRRGPLIARLPAVDDAVNLAEMFIHTEDVRRGAPGWEPRQLPPNTVQALFRQVRGLGMMASRPDKGARTLFEALDGQTVQLGSGPAETRVRGAAPELLLWASGRRDAARVEVTRGVAGSEA